MTALICSFKIHPGCVVPGAMLSPGHSEVPKANGSLIDPRLLFWVKVRVQRGETGPGEPLLRSQSFPDCT